MKTARRSFGKDPYNCLKPWADDTFCQCGGGGVVLTEGDIGKTLSDPEEQVEVIKAVVGEESKKKFYRTAFFEAFPKNPSCFIRGEGKTIEEAEEKAWAKWQKIESCPQHDFDRRDRTDGYCFCKICPLSGTFLKPLTKCIVCQEPTSRYTDKNNVYYCKNHYYELSADQVVDNKPYAGFSVEEQVFHFIEDATLFKDLNILIPLSEEKWREAWDLFIQMRAKIQSAYNPLFGSKTKTDLEIHELIMQAMPVITNEIYKRISPKI